MRYFCWSADVHVRNDSVSLKRVSVLKAVTHQAIYLPEAGTRAKIEVVFLAIGTMADTWFYDRDDRTTSTKCLGMMPQASAT